MTVATPLPPHASPGGPVRALWRRLARIGRGLWTGLRRITDDDAFERYLERHNRIHPQVPPLSRQAFFKVELSRKWEGIRRCC